MTGVMCPARIRRRCYGAQFMSQLHGGWGGRYTTQWVELRSASVPKIVQVPGWWRRDLPLCLPNVESREKEVVDKDPCLPDEEVPIRAIEEVAGVAFHSGARTRGDKLTYRKVRRPCPPPPPQEASPDVLVSQALRLGMAEMQLTIDRLQVVQPDGEHITPEMAEAIEKAAEFQATVARLRGVQPGSKRFGMGIAAAIEQAHGLQNPPEVVSPPEHCASLLPIYYLGYLFTSKT